MSFCTGLKNLHDDDEEVIIVDDIVDDVLLSPALRLKCKRMLIVACISYFSILCPIRTLNEDKKNWGELEKRESLL